MDPKAVCHKRRRARMITLMAMRLMPARRDLPKVVAWTLAFALSLTMWAGLIALARALFALAF
jgi:hypothetical protein